MRDVSYLGRKVLLSTAVLLASAATIGWLGVPAASASCIAVYNEQAILWRGTGTDNATHSFIQGGGMHANTCGDAWATVSIQRDQPSAQASPFLQTGYHTQTSTDLDDCGTGTAPAVVFEYQSTTMGLSACTIYDYLGTPGTTRGDTFAVVKENSGWQVFDNGVAEDGLGNISLGFSSGYSVARGEINHTSTTPQPDFYETWGPTGTTPWQYKAGTLTTYHDVAGGASPLTGDTNDGDTNDWHDGPAPSPFYIQWLD